MADQVAYLIDIGLRPDRARDDLLHEPGYLGHHVNSVELVLKGRLYDGLDRLSVLGGTDPGVFGVSGLGPVVFRVLLGFGVLGGGDGAGGDDLAVLGDAANAYQGGAV